MSLLNRDSQVTGFKRIRYRAPIEGTSGSPIVIAQSNYEGAGHRTFRKLLPLLDQAGKRVFILDLPGAGESDKPRRFYNIGDIDSFIEKFLAEVVKKKATVVAEPLSGSTSLKVSSTRRDLIGRLVLLSPTGINSLATPPSQRKIRLFEHLSNDDVALKVFYEKLLNDFHALKSNMDQRFISLSLGSEPDLPLI